MEERALDLDSLAELIRSMLARLDSEELSRIYPLLETEMLQQMILEAIGVNINELDAGEFDAITEMLRRSLHMIMEKGDG